MDLDRNSREITLDHLKYYYKEALIPEYPEDETVDIEISDGSEIEVPAIDYNYQTLKPDHDFERGNREWEPRKMFLEQNDGLKELPSEFKKRNVEERIAAATKLPKLKFSLQPVKLVKPSYDYNLRTGFNYGKKKNR